MIHALARGCEAQVFLQTKWRTCFRSLVEKRVWRGGALSFLPQLFAFLLQHSRISKKYFHSELLHVGGAGLGSPAARLFLQWNYLPRRRVAHHRAVHDLCSQKKSGFGARGNTEGSQRRLAESRSRNTVAWGCWRSHEAGQAVLIGPFSMSFTACALRVSGTMQSILFAEHSAGMVRVSAYCGIGSMLGK